MLNEKEGEVMKFPNTTVAQAVKVFLYSAFAALLCAILHLSVTMALNMSTRQELGQRVGGVLEDGRTIVSETYNATMDSEAYSKAYIIEEDGSETPIPVEDLEKYPITQSFKSRILSDPDPEMKAIADWVAQILMLILFLAFPYSTLWYLGDHDRNRVLFGHQMANPWRGVQVGALASVPAACMWLLLVVGKGLNTLPGFVKWYRWSNMCFWSYVSHLMPSDILNPADVAWGSVAAMLVPLLAFPAITGLGYFLGYKEISVRDRLIYSATGKTPKRRKR